MNVNFSLTVDRAGIEKIVHKIKSSIENKAPEIALQMIGEVGKLKETKRFISFMQTVQFSEDFGIDPKKSTIFVQSDVPQHAELHVALSMLSTVARLQRMPTFNEYVQVMKEQDIKMPPKTQKKIFFIHVGELAKKKSLRVIEELRSAGIPVVEALGKESIKSQLRTADKQGSASV